MTSNDKTAPLVSLFSYQSTHQEGLELEVCILDTLLRRNRCSHAKTKYYQRLGMASRALQKHNILLLYGEVTSLHQEVQSKIKALKRKQKLDEVFWQMETRNREDDDKEAVNHLYTRISKVGERIQSDLPECLSRLEHAAESLFHEIARAFLLPFCTMAVATIARIRNLLLRLGRYIFLEYLPALQNDWDEMVEWIRSTNQKKGLSIDFCDRLRTLWNPSNENFRKARSVVTAMDDSSGVMFSTPSNTDRALCVANALGIQLNDPPTKSNDSHESVRDTTEQGKKKQPEMNSTVAFSSSSASLNGKVVGTTYPDHDDTGIALHAAEKADHNLLKGPLNKIDSIGFTRVSIDDIDKNSQAVHAYKNSTKTKRKLDEYQTIQSMEKTTNIKKKKRKKLCTNEENPKIPKFEHSVSDETNPKVDQKNFRIIDDKKPIDAKRKKEKKKKKGDFFDELFAR